MTGKSAEGSSVLLLTRHEPPPDLTELEGLCRIETADHDRLTEQLAEHDVLYIWDYFWDRQTSELVNAWPARSSIEWLHIANVGIDKIDSEKIISDVGAVTNASGVYERPIAEYVLASYLFLAKRIRELDRLQQRGEWRRIEGGLVDGGRATVLGAGPIGREIARLLGAVGLRVTLVGRSARVEGDGTVIAAAKDLRGLLPDSDLLVLAAPLTEATRGLIGATELALLGPAGILVNVGRGALVNDDALTDALRNQRIAGAALDVFTEEPLPRQSPYWGLANCLVTSHLSGVTEHWKDRLARTFRDNLRRYLAGEPLENVVRTGAGGLR